jgi:hypothetical protein
MKLLVLFFLIAYQSYDLASSRQYQMAIKEIKQNKEFRKAFKTTGFYISPQIISFDEIGVLEIDISSHVSMVEPNQVFDEKLISLNDSKNHHVEIRFTYLSNGYLGCAAHMPGMHSRGANMNFVFKFDGSKLVDSYSMVVMVD